MKKGNRIIAFVVMMVYLATSIPLSPFVETAYADISDDGNFYSISNEYIKYSINKNTGGFAVETLEGHPQKMLDNNIPLLYKDDIEQSVATSFTTVRIDDRDYVFGRDYSFLDFETELSTPIISQDGQLISTVWTIKKGDDFNYSVLQEVALSKDDLEGTTGNIGISYEVTNNGTGTYEVGIRVLLDTALGNEVDAPYLLIDDSTEPVVVESDYRDDEVPTQIRGLDSMTAPERLSYLIMSDGISGNLKPDRVVLGHWANLANTRYEYTIETFTDFSNYSNKYDIPDAAYALYWNEVALATGATKKAELLYGVGSFDADLLGQNLSMNTTIDKRVMLDNTGKAYEDSGEFEFTVNIDNNLDSSVDLTDVELTVIVEEGLKLKRLNDQEEIVGIGDLKKGETPSLSFTIVAEEQDMLSSKSIVVGITANEPDGSVTYSTDKYVLLPGVKTVDTTVKITDVAPDTVYYQGDKNITITGNMSEFENLDGQEDKWELFLINTNNKADRVEIAKKDIAFLDDSRTALSFSTAVDLAVSEYDIVFEFSDPDLQKQYGQSIKVTETLKVSDDEKYKLRTYGILALIRVKGTSTYTYVAFNTEEEFEKFAASDDVAVQDIYGNLNIKREEVLVVVRGAIKEAKEEDGTIYFTASHSNGDVTINEMMAYTGNEPLIITREEVAGNIGGNTTYDYSISADGLLKVINSIDVWNGDWSFDVSDGKSYSIRGNGTPVTLSLGGAGFMLQNIVGFLVDLKYGELTAKDNEKNGKITDTLYGISFGGSITLPVALPKTKKDATGTSTGDTDTSSTTDNIRETDTSSSQGGNDAPNEGDYSDALEEGDTTTSGAITATDPQPQQEQQGQSSTPMGSLGADIEDIKYGHIKDGNPDENGMYKIADIGFVGIDATFFLGIPEDFLGGFLNNGPNINAVGVVNTLDNIYGLELGVDIAEIISFEAAFMMKQTTMNNVEKMLPDKIAFYIRDGLKIPIAPPLFMTGIGGGVENLADTISGDFEGLAPITILLGMNLEVVEVLEGQLDGSVSATGLTIQGSFGLDNAFSKQKSDSNPNVNHGSPLEGDTAPTTPGGEVTGDGVAADPSTGGGFNGLGIDAGLEVVWADPASVTISGSVNIIDGLISGGITIYIAEDTFYGHAYVVIAVPNSVPIIGGTPILGVEAAVSSEFVGAKVTFIGIDFGVIYYWSGDYSFGSDIDLSIDAMQGPQRRMARAFSEPIETVTSDGSVVNAMYGTNLKPLTIESEEVTNIAKMSSMQFANVGEINYLTNPILFAQGSTEHTVKLPANDEDSLVLSIAYSGIAPNTENVELKRPDGTQIVLKPSVGSEGNFILQNIGEDRYIHISLFGDDAKRTASEDWTLTLPEGTTLRGTAGFAASNLPEVTEVSFTRTGGIESRTIDSVSYKVDSDANTAGDLNIYVTKDKDILNKVKQSNVKDSLGTLVAHNDLTAISDAKVQGTIELPEGLDSGDYYVVATLALDAGGMSTVISKKPFTFDNPNLPDPVKDVKVIYAGNGSLYVEVKDADTVNYTDYIIDIVDEDGSTTGYLGQFNIKEKIYLDNLNLTEGEGYKVRVRTLNAEKEKDALGNEIIGGNTKNFYGAEDEIKESNLITMPTVDKPVLVSVESSITSEGLSDSDSLIVSKDQIIMKYTFDREVLLNWKVNGMENEMNSFEKVWEISHPLSDGDYIIGFEAIGFNKDMISDADYKDIFADAQFGFTVDTGAPVLTLSQKEGVTNKLSAAGGANVFANNIVTADKDGDYEITGITEKDAEILINGEDAQIVVDGSGLFTISGNLKGKASEELTVTAVDKAKNSTSVVATVLSEGLGNITEITIKQRVTDEDGTIILKDIEENTAEELELEVGFYETIELVAVGIAELSDGTKVEIVFANEDVTWNVPIEKNKVRFNQGQVTLIEFGEAAVAASVPVGIVTTIDGSNTKENLVVIDSYVRISVTDGDKEDLEILIDEAKTSLANPKNATSADKAKLQQAIDNAQSVIDDARATVEEIEKAIEDLTDALAEFEIAKNQSSGSGGGGFGGGTVYHDVTAEAGANGTVEVSHERVADGTSVTITSTPDVGYEVVSVEINGKYYSNEDVITIASVEEDLYIYVTFGMAWENEYTDVNATDWFYDAVRYVSIEGLMNGVGNGLFSPNTELTRGMLVTILGRMADADVEGFEATYDDVMPNMYYTQYTAWATAAKIVNGTGNNMFEPDAAITREAMATMLYRFLVLAGGGFEDGETYELDFIDRANISEWAYEAVAYLTMEGVIAGKPGNMFDPKGEATRAEIATVIQRIARVILQNELEIPVILPATEIEPTSEDVQSEGEADANTSEDMTQDEETQETEGTETTGE